MRSCITMFSFRKRKRKFDESMDHYRKMCKQRIEKKMQEMDGEFMSIVATTLSNLTVKKTKKRRSKDVQRDQTWWADGYRNWSDVEFKKKLRLNRETFDFILDRIRPELEKKPTNAKPNPTTVDRQLASTLYCTLMAHPSLHLDIYSKSQKSWLATFFTKLLVLLFIFCTKSSSGYR